MRCPSQIQWCGDMRRACPMQASASCDSCLCSEPSRVVVRATCSAPMISCVAERSNAGGLLPLRVRTTRVQRRVHRIHGRHVDTILSTQQGAAHATTHRKAATLSPITRPFLLPSLPSPPPLTFRDAGACAGAESVSHRPTAPLPPVRLRSPRRFFCRLVTQMPTPNVKRVARPSMATSPPPRSTASQARSLTHPTLTPSSLYRQPPLTPFSPG